jgi:hypothetical protein
MEMDIAELYDPGRETVVHNVYWKSTWTLPHWAGLGRYRGVKVPGLGEGFHTFGMEWMPGRLDFYVDGHPTWSYLGTTSDIGGYLVLGMEVGPEEARVVRATPGFVDRFIVDYVRVYLPLDPSWR